MWIHALLGSAGAQASSYRHIRPEHLNNSLPYVSKLEAMSHRCAACSPYQVTGVGASIHGLSGTEDVRASPFVCIRPEKVNRFVLHVAAYAGPEEPVRLLRFWPDQYLKLQQYFFN